MEKIYNAFFVRYSSPSFALDRELPKCVGSCPANCDVRGFIALIAEGRYNDAYRLIKEKIPFPGILGRICHRPCEQSCKRGVFDEAVASAHLKRFAADHHNSDSQPPGKRGKKVAIIGSGPAGLTAALDLSRKYMVTIFESSPKIGGMLRLIPRFELPEEVLQKELELPDWVEIKTNFTIGKEEIEDLRKKYDAILIACGLRLAKSLRIKGANLKGVHLALNFLENINSGVMPFIGERVVVIGGGNVAIDVARSAIRLHADVRLFCLESREEMPALGWKIADAMEEGVKIYPSWGPREIVGREKVEGVNFIRCTSVFDSEGRFSPKFDESKTFHLDADSVIFAIGQSSELSFLAGTKVQIERGIIKVDPLTLATSEPGFFAAGDVVRGPSSVVEAIADGHRAAESIDRWLGGLDLKEGRSMLRIPEEGEDEIELLKSELLAREAMKEISRKERVKPPKISLEERKEGWMEVEQCLPPNLAVAEAGRCFSCRRCILVPVSKNKVKNEDEIKNLIRLTKANLCIGCGKCSAICHVTERNPDFIPRKLVADVMDSLLAEQDLWSCNTCGRCSIACPYGVDFLGFVRGVRRIALTNGWNPKFSATGLVTTYEVGEELKWNKLKIAEKSKVYYWVGCLPYLENVYSERNLHLLDIARSAVYILNSLGEVPAVSKGTCCGHDLLWAGDQDAFISLAESNVEVIRRSGAETVIFTCAECLRTFKKDYDFLDAEFLHLSEYVKDKELNFKEFPKQTITYHDPCRLGRHLGIYDPPREVIKMIPNIELVEMKHARDRSLCCGVSAFVTCGEVSRKMQVDRLMEAKRTGADKLITACPKCLIHFSCSLSSNIKDGSLIRIGLEDLTVAIARSLR